MKLTVFAALTLSSLAGCSSYSPQSLRAGASAAEIAARMGAPTGRYPLPAATGLASASAAAERLEYARGPYGRHTFMLDLDAQGRLQSWAQVLDESNFNALRAGLPRHAVLARIGHPSQVRAPSGPRTTWTVWSYRYETPFCQWFQVTIDGTTDTVAETGYGPDPLCYDDGDRRAP